MFTLWAKRFVRNKMIDDTTVTDATDDSRTAKVFHAVTRVCREFDLAEPIWLDMNIREFQRHSKTRFNQDNFIEGLDFDYMEIQIIEED